MRTRRSACGQPDAPPNERIPQSFLFAFKRLLLKWDYDTKCVWVDVPSRTLYVGNEKVNSTGVDGTDMITDFGEGWGDYLRCDELEKMMQVYKQRLRTSLRRRSSRDYFNQGLCGTRPRLPTEGPPRSQGRLQGQGPVRPVRVHPEGASAGRGRPPL